MSRVNNLRIQEAYQNSLCQRDETRTIAPQNATGRYVWRNGHWTKLDLDAPRPKPSAPMIMRDTDPYPSIITGEVIGGRRQHREHLKAHGCVEVGNEMPSPSRQELPPVRADLERALQASPETHAAAQRGARGR